MVVNHSVKLSFDLCFARLCLKNCTLKKPFFARRKTDLKRGFVPKKKRMLIKPRYGSSFRRLGLVPAAPSFRAATSEHTTPWRNLVIRPSSRKGSTPYLNSMYGKRVQATFTPILLHYIISYCRCQHNTNICLYILMRFFVAISLIYANGYVIMML